MQPQLERIIHELQAVQPEIIRLGYRGSVGYFRPIMPEESMRDVMEEAEVNGSVVAYRGEIVCIMPRLCEGWMQIFGRRRSDALNAIREHMQEVDEA